MNSSDSKLLNRWLPRLEDRSDEVKVNAVKNLAEIALRNADQRNFLSPRLLQVAHTSNSWAVLSNGFFQHASAIAEFDPTWAEDFFEAYLAIARKNIEIASGESFEKMLSLLERNAVDPSSPLAVSANKIALELLKSGSNEYIRDNLFALTDWYEDHVDKPVHSPIIEDVPFVWPTTQASASEDSLDSDTFPLEVGVLSAIGYAVGSTNGMPQTSRRKLLSDFFSSTPSLPKGHPQVREWGVPRSSGRLLKLANTIAAHTRNAKRRRQPPSVAITDWESDLAFLKVSFYDAVFDFHWPSTFTR